MSRLREIDEPDSTLARRISLAGEQIALWRIDLNATAASESRWRSILSPDEIERADRFHFDRDRRSYCATRGMLRIILAGYAELAPREIQFQYSPKGKPELAPGDLRERLAFNVSHSGDVALIGIACGRPIGVDVEKIRRDFDTDAIARRFFSVKEQEDLASLPDEQRYRAFYTCWTLKESFIKALGEGLSHPLHQFDVVFGRANPVPLTTRPDPAEARRWELRTLDVGVDYAAACTVQNALP